MIGWLLCSAGVSVAWAKGAPTLHERISENPRNDLALGLTMAGEMPAGIETNNGVVQAPDPFRPAGPKDAPYSPTRPDAPQDSTFSPDRDTKRPDSLSYDEPFSPSTAPFKRVNAFDSIDANYILHVRDTSTEELTISPNKLGDDEDHFFADMVVDLVPGKPVRIPSVGPKSRVLRASLVAGHDRPTFRLVRDGAENWFIDGSQAVRARLVMELAVPRVVFGGDYGNPGWTELPPAAVLPENAARAAVEVEKHIGVSASMRPRDALAKLVGYFRSFEDSPEGPSPSRDIYLDLALSKKGVCRHRSFAFFVTASHLGLPSRVVTNEAHAWVEVHDGKLWRRIDLGGAGRMMRDPLSQNVTHQTPDDPFQWPAGSTRGAELAERTRDPQPGQRDASGRRTPTPAGNTDPAAPLDPGAPGVGPGRGVISRASAAKKRAMQDLKDDRPRSTIVTERVDAKVVRGATLQLQGHISAENERCPHVMLDVLLRGGNGQTVFVGSVATDSRGAFNGKLVLQHELQLGDYELILSTDGDARCGIGTAQ